MTLRQLRRFLGVTGYCSIWILGYGELVWPLYLYFILILITEIQQAQTNEFFWSPEAQKAFETLQTALLRASALSFP